MFATEHGRLSEDNGRSSHLLPCGSQGSNQVIKLGGEHH